MIPLLGYAMYICIYIHTYICICICVHIQIHIQIDTNIYIYRYIHNVTYMHIHTYINTKKFMYRHISTCLPARDTIHTSHVTRVTRLIHKCDMTHLPKHRRSQERSLLYVSFLHCSASCNCCCSDSLRICVYVT